MYTPLVSIVCVTYNHEPYLRKALDGFLMQKTTFPIEIVLAEDCSTDGTRSICEEYAAKYPILINYIWSELNVGPVENERRAFAVAKGKYIATCEGDDYWTEPLKLQRQVDFLESHPGYSVCFTRYNKYWESTGNLVEGNTSSIVNWKGQDELGIELSMSQALHHWCTQYLTMVFRASAYEHSLPDRYKYFRDTHQFYHLMLNGKCRILNFISGDYRITGTGQHSIKDYFRQEQMTLAVDTELWKVNHDIRWKEMCAIVMQDLVDHYDGEKTMMFLWYSLLIFCYNGGFRKFIKNCSKVLFF